MPRKKKVTKEQREESKKQRLATIGKEKKIKFDENRSVLTDKEFQDNSKILDKMNIDEMNQFISQERILKAEKNALQSELESFENPVICDTPEFLVNTKKEAERKNVMGKIKYLLKRRFALVTIADILETNTYEKLDEIIERKEEIYKLIEKYSAETENIKLFSDFKKNVGDEYSRTYAEQEDRMKAAVAILYDGKYIKKGAKADDKILAIEDIVSSVIDHPEFNLACQIETSFVMHELDRSIEILSDLSSRAELSNLVEELKKLSLAVEERSHAYSVMDRLISGKKEERKIIKSDEQQR